MAVLIDPAGFLLIEEFSFEKKLQGRGWLLAALEPETSRRPAGQAVQICPSLTSTVFDSEPTRAVVPFHYSDILAVAIWAKSDSSIK